MDENIETLLNLSSKKVDAKVIVEHNDKVKRANRKQSKSGKKKDKPESSVFTEEDFEKFSASYFINSKVEQTKEEF